MLGTRIRQGRARAGLSIRDLGVLLGVAHATVGHWETGRHAPSVEKLLRIAEVTGVDIAWLVSGSRRLEKLQEITDIDELRDVSGGLHFSCLPADAAWVSLCKSKWW